MRVCGDNPSISSASIIYALEARSWHEWFTRIGNIKGTIAQLTYEKQEALVPIIEKSLHFQESTLLHPERIEEAIKDHSQEEAKKLSDFLHGIYRLYENDRNGFFVSHFHLALTIQGLAEQACGWGLGVAISILALLMSCYGQNYNEYNTSEDIDIAPRTPLRVPELNNQVISGKINGSFKKLAESCLKRTDAEFEILISDHKDLLYHMYKYICHINPDRWPFLLNLLVRLAETEKPGDNNSLVQHLFAQIDKAEFFKPVFEAFVKGDPSQFDIVRPFFELSSLEGRLNVAISQPKQNQIALIFWILSTNAVLETPTLKMFDQKHVGTIKELIQEASSQPIKDCLGLKTRQETDKDINWSWYLYQYLFRRGEYGKATSLNILGDEENKVGPGLRVQDYIQAFRNKLQVEGREDWSYLKAAVTIKNDRDYSSHCEHLAVKQEVSTRLILRVAEKKENDPDWASKWDSMVQFKDRHEFYCEVAEKILECWSSNSDSFNIDELLEAHAKSFYSKKNQDVALTFKRDNPIGDNPEGDHPNKRPRMITSNNIN